MASHLVLVNDKHYWSVIHQFPPMFDFKTFIHMGGIMSRSGNDEDPIENNQSSAKVSLSIKSGYNQHNS